MCDVPSSIKRKNHLYIVTKVEKVSTIEMKIKYILGSVQTKILFDQKGSIVFGLYIHISSANNENSAGQEFWNLWKNQYKHLNDRSQAILYQVKYMYVCYMQYFIKLNRYV